MHFASPAAPFVCSCRQRPFGGTNRSEGLPTPLIGMCLGLETRALSPIAIVPNLAAMKLPGRSFAIALVAIGTACPACTCGSYEPAPAPAAQPTEAPAAPEPAPAASAEKPRFKRIKQKRTMVERVQRLEGMKLDVGAAKAQDGAKAQPANANP